MIKFKSKRKVERYDEYNRSLGMFTMRMIINGINRENDLITPYGFYYYINDVDECITVAPIKNTSFTREQAAQIEAQLPPLTSNNIFDVIDERAVQFTFLKWQMENGSSFGLMADEWEIDVD
ncbi:hypothetical protein L0B70_00375 [Kaistella sp. 97-N-M2]|uniref:hypothetical protein n=1 Tax=Kaistella sp. 97-N-M2 TaxID=2908645 RepID=UPI001F238134|nr:hypothetical protein [Kaistella sp. 97-N-M2]UJF29883.1 hypothetical protein L0B70_00375 [Kaistella sp. 97-N-M2]